MKGSGSAGDGSSNGGYLSFLSSSEITYNYDTGWYYPRDNVLGVLRYWLLGRQLLGKCL